VEYLVVAETAFESLSRTPRPKRRRSQPRDSELVGSRMQQERASRRQACAGPQVYDRRARLRFRPRNRHELRARASARSSSLRTTARTTGSSGFSRRQRRDGLDREHGPQVALAPQISFSPGGSSVEPESRQLLRPGPASRPLPRRRCSPAGHIKSLCADLALTHDLRCNRRERDRGSERRRGARSLAGHPWRECVPGSGDAIRLAVGQLGVIRGFAGVHGAQTVPIVIVETSPISRGPLLEVTLDQGSGGGLIARAGTFVPMRTLSLLDTVRPASPRGPGQARIV
jgi:hypothetical protein